MAWLVALVLAGAIPLACGGSDDPGADAPRPSPATDPVAPGPGGTTPVHEPIALPDGISVAYAAPGDIVESGRSPAFAVQAAATVDRHGQPVVVWANYTDATGRAAVVQVSRYDPDSGSWTKPVEVFSGRLGHDQMGRSLDVTTDRRTGALHLVWAQAGDEGGPTRTLSLASSADDGQTWRTQRVTEQVGVAAPVVAAADDVVQVAFWSEHDGVVRAVGTPATSSQPDDGADTDTPVPDPTTDRQWVRTVAPTPPGWVPLATAPAIALDQTGSPVVAYAVTTPDGHTQRILVWNPDQTSPWAASEPATSLPVTAGSGPTDSVATGGSTEPATRSAPPTASTPGTVATDPSVRPIADLDRSGPPALAIAVQGDQVVVAFTGTSAHLPGPVAPTEAGSGDPVPATPNPPESSTAQPGNPTTSLPPSTSSTEGLNQPTARPWAWVARRAPSGPPTAPVALDTGPTGPRRAETPRPPGLGLAVLPDGTAAVALVPVATTTATCLVAWEGPDHQTKPPTACSQSAKAGLAQVAPSGRTPSLVRLGDGRLAVPLGNSAPAPGLPAGLVLWTGPA